MNTDLLTQDLKKKRSSNESFWLIGQPDIETPQLMLDAVRHSDFKILDYGHSAGNESYRRKLVKYYKSVGVDVDYKQILITTGGSEALLFAFMACFDPGDEKVYA